VPFFYVQARRRKQPRAACANACHPKCYGERWKRFHEVELSRMRSNTPEWNKPVWTCGHSYTGSEVFARLPRLRLTCEHVFLLARNRALCVMLLRVLFIIRDLECVSSVIRQYSYRFSGCPGHCVIILVHINDFTLCSVSFLPKK
jgi:hypothetical protein